MARKKKPPEPENYAQVHDSDLHTLKSYYPSAKAEDKRRTQAAALIRATLARVFARGDICTFSQWGVVPCLTPENTIGILVITDGTARDTLIPCPEAESLGLAKNPIAGANNPAAGISTALVEVDASPLKTVDGPNTVRTMLTSFTPLKDGPNVHNPAPNMPEGWRQIGLPTWRGHEGTSPYRSTPREGYTKDLWIKPTQVAFGLMTCYGHRGKPRRTLDDTAGWHQDRPSSENHWPNGVPDWITKGFEPVDPSWWPLNQQQQQSIHAMIETWLLAAIRHIAQSLPNQQEIEWALTGTPQDHLEHSSQYNITCMYPDQREQSYTDRSNAQVIKEAVNFLRGQAARQAASQVCKEVGIFRVYRARERDNEIVGARRIDQLHGLLTQVIYQRLDAVAQSLGWMLTFPRMPEYSTPGPNSKEFENILEATARNIGMVTVKDLELSARQLVEEDMVTVLYNDPPGTKYH